MIDDKWPMIRSVLIFLGLLLVCLILGWLLFGCAPGEAEQASKSAFEAMCPGITVGLLPLLGLALWKVRG